MNNTKAKLALLVVAILWGGGFIGTEFGLQIVTPNQLLFFRFFFASILFYILNVKSINKNFKKSLRPGLITGLFLFFGFLLQTNGQSFTTPSSTAFLTSTSVIFVPIIYCIDNRILLQKHVFISILFCMVGIAMLTIDSTFSINIGDLLSLLCAFAFALHIYYSGRLSKRYKLEITSFTFVQFLTASSLFLILFLFDTPSFDTFTTSGVLGIAYLVVFATVICYFLQLNYQRFVDETSTSLILSTEAVFATIMSVFILKEVLNTTQILGIIIIFLAVLYCETKFAFLKRKKA